MRYIAKRNFEKECEAIENSDMDEYQKANAIAEAQIRRDYIFAMEDRKDKEKEEKCNSTYTPSFSFTTSQSSNTTSVIDDDDIENICTGCAYIGIPLAKLVPPFIMGTLALSNLDKLKNLNIFDKLMCHPDTSKIALGICIAWGALSLYGSHLSVKKEAIKKVYGTPNLWKLNFIRFQQLAALACIGFVFYHSIDELSQIKKEIEISKTQVVENTKQHPVQKEANAILLLSAAGLAYQTYSCFLKHKKIRTYEDE